MGGRERSKDLGGIEVSKWPWDRKTDGSKVTKAERE